MGFQYLSHQESKGEKVILTKATDTPQALHSKAFFQTQVDKCHETSGIFPKTLYRVRKSNAPPVTRLPLSVYGGGCEGMRKPRYIQESPSEA